MRELIEAVYDDSPTVNAACGLDTADLQASYEKLVEVQAKEAGEAGQYLIPDPSPTTFNLARMCRMGHSEEEKGAASSYFHAPDTAWR